MTVTRQSFECCFISAKERHPFLWLWKCSFLVFTREQLYLTVNHPEEKNQIQRKEYWPTHLLLSEGELLAETFMIEPGALDFSPAAAAAAKSVLLLLLSRFSPTLCDPIDGSPPGSPIPGILQARILEWVAISFSNAWKWKVQVKSFSRVQLLATPWTATYQAPLSMGFSRLEYWSGVPLTSPSQS